MLAILEDLVRHKWYANASLLNAIRQHEPAAHDQPLRELLHHILLANRFWLRQSRGVSYPFEADSAVPESMDTMVHHYRETEQEEMAWLAELEEAGLSQAIQTPYIPGKSFSVAEAMMQVCLHSHGHRAQCASRLRQLGGQPPVLDFIAWLKDRPSTDWTRG